MFLRAYPTVTHFINDFFNADFPILPIYSFGFFVALAFLAAAYILGRELKRKERLGLLSSSYREITIGKPASPVELIWNGAIGFVLGYKLVYVFFNYAAFSANPQGVLFSGEGHLLGGLLGAALLAGIKFWEKHKARLQEPKIEKVEVPPHQRVGDITIVAAVAGILGAKVFHYLEYPEQFTADPYGALLSFSGLTIYGGLIFGAVFVLIYARMHRIKMLHLIDAAAPALILAYAIGRIGCHVAGDGDWGIVNTNPKPGWLSWLPDGWWANLYAHNVNGEGVFIPGCEGAYCYQLAAPVWPTSVYETTMGIIIFLFLWSIRKKAKAPGLIFGLYLIFNGIERFFIEQIRVNVKLDFLGMKLTQAEIISIVFLIIGILFSIAMISRYRNQNQEKTISA